MQQTYNISPNVASFWVKLSLETLFTFAKFFHLSILDYIPSTQPGKRKRKLHELITFLITDKTSRIFFCVTSRA